MVEGTYKKIIKAIESHDNIFIFHHIRPDGDCLGSQFGLKELIKNNYPNKKVFAVGDSKDVLNFLEFKNNNKHTKKDFINSLGIVVDASSSDRIEHKELILEKKLTKMARIDHHPNGADINYDYNWIDSSFVAAAEQVGYLALKAKWKLSIKAAKYIYLGINTDSGRFFYSKTSQRTFDVVSFLMSSGLNVFEDIHKHMASRKLNEVKFMAEVLTKFKTKGNIAYFYISQDMMNKYDLTYSQASNVNILSNIQSFYVWVFFIQEEDSIRVRIRSNGPVINDVARKYNGGGHDLASGATIKNKKQITNLIDDLQLKIDKYLKY